MITVQVIDGLVKLDFGALGSAWLTSGDALQLAQMVTDGARLAGDATVIGTVESDDRR